MANKCNVDKLIRFNFLESLLVIHRARNWVKIFHFMCILPGCFFFGFWFPTIYGAWQKDPKPAELRPAAAGLRRDWGGVNQNLDPLATGNTAALKSLFLPHLSLLLHPL